MRRKLLGRFELDDQLEHSIDDNGLLDLWFGHAVLVQDYVNGESRIIRFGFGAIEVANDGSTSSAFLLVDETG